MSKEWKNRNALRTALVSVAFAGLLGCEAEGPADKAGKSIDKGIQNAKEAVDPAGPAEQAGRNLDKALKP